MAIDAGKRALLRGRLQPAVTSTPPWAIAPDGFVDACTRCGVCVTHCPEQILVHGGGGFPAVDFSRGACTYCRTCVTACPTGALSADVDPPWAQTARIADTCLTRAGVYCQSCRDGCPVSAIRFTPIVGRVPAPRVDGNRCNGCGACVSACPSDAIAIFPEPSP